MTITGPGITLSAKADAVEAVADNLTAIIDVNRLGKAATWILYLSIGCRIVTHDATSWPLWLFWIGLGMAVVASMFYARDAWRALRS